MELRTLCKSSESTKLLKLPLDRIRYISDIQNVRNCLADIIAPDSRIGINGAGLRVLQCQWALS